MNKAAEQFVDGGNERDNKNLGPFATAAEALWHAGLAPIPVGGEDGKKPLVTRFTKWKHRPNLITIQNWIGKYPDANIAIVTGQLSDVVLVDIDSTDPALRQQMIERFGDTLIKTRTPRGDMICGIAIMEKAVPIWPRTCQSK